MVLLVNEDHQAVRADLAPQGHLDRGASQASRDPQAGQDRLVPVGRTDGQDPLDQ